MCFLRGFLAGCIHTSSRSAQVRLAGSVTLLTSSLGRKPGVVPCVSLPTEAKIGGANELRTWLTRHEEKGFCLKSWWHLFHLSISFHFCVFPLAQEKTSKTFVVSKRRLLFSSAFWEDGLPEENKRPDGKCIHVYTKSFHVLGGLYGKFSWKLCQSFCALWFGCRSSEVQVKKWFFASFVLNQHMSRF